MYEFRWIAWNVNHIAAHGVETQEAEHVVNRAARPWPKIVDGDKRLVWGATAVGRHLQVIYVLDPDDTVFVIHAMELPENKKRQFRRRRR